MNQRLAEIARLGPNWDSYDAEPISTEAVDSARRLVQMAVERFGGIVGERAIPDAVLPVPDGGVHLQWDRPAADLQVQISPDGVMHYLLIERRGTEEVFTEDQTGSEARIFELLDGVLRL